MTNDGETALMYAAAEHRTDSVRFLIEHGADILMTDSHTMTALEYAAPDEQDVDWYEQHPNAKETVELLIRKLMTLPRNPATNTTQPYGIPLPPNRPDLVALKERIDRLKQPAFDVVSRGRVSEEPGSPRLVRAAKVRVDSGVKEFLGGKRKSKKSRKRHTARRRHTTRKRRK
ncbi:MAG TPA: ankyrin repeat domain-containing protein [Dehalococcoidia bacterium]|nr:ankyrin repeat domain-containing protein [Dehalococcoidia bacterium]